MKTTLRRVLARTLVVLPCLAVSVMAAEPANAQFNVSIPHAAIGSWFGKAVQVCASAATCQNVALFMTPTLTQDNEFIGNDSLTLGGAPFGPHTTAHGRWIPTSRDSIVADYVFMLSGTTAQNLSVLRFRWHATVVDYNTMVGYVNAYFGAPVPMAWENLSTNQYPTMPDETAPFVNAPVNFYTDPTVCTSGPLVCPLIFKFTIKRVQP